MLPNPLFSVFSHFRFSGLIYNTPESQLFHRALPFTPPIVKEILGHVTVRGMHHSCLCQQLLGASSLATHIFQGVLRGKTHHSPEWRGRVTAALLDPDWHSSQLRPCSLSWTWCSALPFFKRTINSSPFSTAETPSPPSLLILVKITTIMFTDHLPCGGVSWVLGSTVNETNEILLGAWILAFYFPSNGDMEPLPLHLSLSRTPVGLFFLLSPSKKIIIIKKKI